MMTAANSNFIIEAGTDFSKTWTYEDSDCQPIDLTGWTARLFFKRRFSDVDAAKEYTTENSSLIISGMDGEITLIIANEDTSELSGTYRYDLELIDLDDKVTRLLQGYVTISPEVTK